MSTPHKTARMGDIAETVLLPGDPLRAKFIAEHFLEENRKALKSQKITELFGNLMGSPVFSPILSGFQVSLVSK